MHTRLRLIVFELISFAYKPPAMPTEAELGKIEERTESIKRSIRQELTELEEKVNQGKDKDRKELQKKVDRIKEYLNQ